MIKDKGESKREVLDDSDLPIVINLRTKKEFVKADFGKFYGSGGTRDRYESGALVNTFRDTLQISFIGYANNVSRQGFDYSELGQYGGLDRAENNSFSSMNYGGLQNKVSAGINANYDVAKKLKTNLMYTYEHQNDYVDNKGINSTFYDTITETTNSHHNSTYKNYGHLVRAFIRYAPDTTSRLSLETNLNFRQNTGTHAGSYSRLRDEATSVQKGENNSRSISASRQYQYHFSAEKKFTSSKVLLSLNHHYNNQLSENENLGHSLNRYYLFNDSTVDQGTLRSGTGDNLTIGNTLNAQIPVRKHVNWDWYARYDWELNRNLEDIDNKINTDQYSNRNDVANNKQGRFGSVYLGTKVNASLFKEKLQVSAGVEWLGLNRSYHYYGKAADLHDHHYYWLPNASLTYNGMTLSYHKRASLPSFYQIVAVDSDLYPTSLTIASPYFDNQLEETMRVSYYKWFEKIKVNLHASANYTAYNTSIGSKTAYDVTTSESVNERYQTPGTDRFYANAYLMKRFAQNKVWNVSWTVSGYGSTSSSYTTINGEENKARNTNANLTNTFSATYRNNVTLIPTYGISINGVKNQRQTTNFRNISNTIHSIGAMLRLDNISRFRLETAYTLKNQPQSFRADRINLHLVNASLYYPIAQQKGELKFTAFDILNQNQNIYMGGYGNTNYYQEHLTLRQYFMLGLVYKFLATPGN